MKSFHKGVRRGAAVAIGTVFVLAGFFKLMDPVGSGLIVEDYLKFFHLWFLLPASKVLGFIFAITESLVGVLLVTGIWRLFTAIASATMLGFFTILTIILAAVNPVMDCGCFGEAIHLTHAQTLVKNLILDALWCASFIPFKNFGEPKKVKFATAALASLSLSAFAAFSLSGVPKMDFTDYNAGAELQQDDALLSLCNFKGEYLDSLEFNGNFLLVSEYDPQKVAPSRQAEIIGVLRDAHEAGFEPMLLMSVAPDELGDEICYSADRRTLMTLNRSNGGAVFVSDGQIIWKWSASNLPEKDELEELLQKNPTEEMLRRTVRDRMQIQGFLLYVFAVMLLL